MNFKEERFYLPLFCFVWYNKFIKKIKVERKKRNMTKEELDEKEFDEQEEEALDILADIGVPFGPCGEPLGI
mgnify:CR=1 FL=1